MILNAYARLMCRLIWAARRILPAKDGAPPNISWLRRDWEWESDHHCEVCGFRGKHRFVAWADEDITTAECPRCGLEATL